MTGLRPKSASAPKLASQLYGTIPAFPSWARMKQDEKGNTARPRNSASRTLPAPFSGLGHRCRSKDVCEPKMS